MIEAALVALVASMVAVAVLVGLWKGAQATVVTQEARLVRMGGELGATRQQLAAVEDARAHEKTRAELVMTNLKTEIASLENDLAACESPDVVRDRLRRLLGSPTPPADSGALGAGGMSSRPSSLRGSG